MKKAAQIIILILLLSCESATGGFILDEKTIVHTCENSSIREYSIGDFTGGRNYLLFIFVDATCSSCILEMNWWGEFLKAYNGITPVLIINTEPTIPNSIELFFREIMPFFSNNEYPVIQEQEFSIRFANKLFSKTSAVLTDRSFNILYKGNPMKDPEKFDKTYRRISKVIYME